MNSAEKILESIAIEIARFEDINEHVQRNKMCCVLSLENTQILVDNFYDKTNQKRPKKFSSIEAYGVKILPSEFMNNLQFGICEIKTI